MDYAAEINEALLVTQEGAPVFALVPLLGEDMESISLSTNEDFIALIERSRQATRQEGTISLEEMRRLVGVPGEGRSEAQGGTEGRDGKT